MTRPIIDVDENGYDGAGGFKAELLWTDRAEKTGLFERRPATFRYPDGWMEDVIQVFLTAQGLALMAELNETGGTARVGPSGQVLRSVG